ncbi:PpiC-type peptidyl-prolyl cis-trans isomerase [Parvibaculum lavamentivorans DS-1]|uniref:Parvulin-like PPIase n=1 Tax=Parvibaculum lavamentivorans (strain DS-1 / DSM 13023 / NCIMB 13966) TaxID=402881 RepID=A7HXZ1_PARL1|nr:peptidylprolyl isomerase [Parvibaculum lavamentivorans]ABS64774.1 PpiC-type peptidyl-prolyl cis-trans isomerase [Parvibaculum lavamentivorans DS-1]
MLDSLRRNASGWVAKVLIGLLALSFAVWGIADIFTGFGGDTVAEVGDQKIDAATYQVELRNEMNQFSQRLGQPLSLDQARQFGIDRAALSRLISLAALDGAASDLGLAVGDEAVGIDITTDPNLQGPFGRFDRDLFRQSLQQNGISEERFIEQRRRAMSRKQVIEVIQVGVAAPEALIEMVSRFQEETRVAGYVILPQSLVGEIADPDEETVQKFYEAGASAFTLPETRDFSIMVLEPEDVTRTMAVSEEDLQAAYEQRRGEYDVPERRDVHQITFASEEEANEALTKLRGGENVETVVKGLGLTMKDVDLGKVSRDDMLSPELADAAFSLEGTGYSEPVRGPLGWSILHVTGIEPGKPSTYEDVKEELRAAIELELARDQIYDIQNTIEDARAGGEPLADVAKRYNLTVRSIDGITADGKTRNGDTVELPELPDLLNTVYENQQGDQIPPLDSGKDGYYWVEIDAVNPAELQPLDEVRDRVVSIWKQQKRADDLEALATSLVERGNAGESFEKIAAEYGRSVLSTPPLQRYAQNDTFSRTAVTRLFAAPEGGFTFGPVGLGDSLIVMQVKDVRSPQLDANSDKYKETRTTLVDAIQADMLQTFVVGYQQELGVEVNNTLFQQMTATDTGL